MSIQLIVDWLNAWWVRYVAYTMASSDHSELVLPITTTDMPVEPQKAPPEPSNPPNKLFAFSDSIATYEGGHTPGDRAHRNNNPLDYRWPFGGKLPNHAIGTDKGNFLIFDTWQHGFNFGQKNIENACRGLSKVYSPNDTVLEFFEKYAPSSDANNPLAYAQFVCQRVGITLHDPIKNLVA